MLLNAKELVAHGIIVDKQELGAKAQTGYDCTLMRVEQMANTSEYGHALFMERTMVNEELYQIMLPEVRSDGIEMWDLPPNTSYRITFDQGCKLPNNISVDFKIRSSLARMGCILTCGLFDPGFYTDNMGVFMRTGGSRVFIEHHARVAQLIAHETHEAELYKGQWQNQ